jgi:ligand-binding sensor domain-containing protein
MTKPVFWGNVFILAFLLWTSGPCLGQYRKKPVFDHYGPAQGFPSAQALVVEKAKNGFLYIGTDQGLVSYDGHDFSIFRHDVCDSTTISSDYIRKMKFDKHGRLWVSALPALNIFDPSTGTFSLIHYIDVNHNAVNFVVQSFWYDEPNDVMWLGTNIGLLYSQGKEISLHRESVPVASPQHHSWNVILDSTKTFWLANTYGLTKYSQEDCTIKTYHRPDDNPKLDNDDGFTSLYLDKKGTIWLGCWVNGLVKFNTRTYQSKRLLFADENIVQNGVMAIAQTHLPNEDTILWLATTDGIKVFNTEKETFLNLSTSSMLDLHGIQGAGFCLKAVPDEGLWIGTYSGLHKYDYYKQYVSEVQLDSHPNEADRIVSEMALEHTENKDSLMWCMIPYNRIIKYDLTRQKIVSVPDKLKKYCQSRVNPNTIYIDKKDRLWISTDEYGLIQYYVKRDIIQNPEIINQVNGMKVLSLEEDSAGKIWLFSTIGLLYLDETTNNILAEDTVNLYLKNHRFNPYLLSGTTDKQNRIWLIGRKSGDLNAAILSYDTKTKLMVSYLQNDYPELKGLQSMENLVMLKNGNILITSYNGFCIMNIQQPTPVFHVMNTFKNRPLGNIKTAVEDDNGNLWLSHDYGVVRYQFQNHNLMFFANYNSAIGQWPNPNLRYSSISGNLYIAQKNSINIIATKNITQTTSAQIVLTSLAVAGQKKDHLPASGSTLTLTHLQNNLNLSFSNLCFTNSDQNTYRYILEGSGQPWTALQYNTINFNNLSPGQYTLRVNGENSFGQKARQDFVLYINITPPFHQTWYFTMMIIILFAGIFYNVFKYREWQRRKLEQLRHSIARDLHDDMGSNLSYIRMLSEYESLKNQDNPAFKRISDKTAEVMNNMSEIIWSINPYYDTLKNVIIKIQELAIDTLEPLGIEVKFDTEDIPSSLRLSPENKRHYYLICKEAINNAAKYSGASTFIFKVTFQSKTFTTSIIDNGTGFNPILIKMGNGLKNMKSRAMLLHGKLEIDTNPRGTNITLVMQK